MLRAMPPANRPLAREISVGSPPLGKCNRHWLHRNGIRHCAEVQQHTCQKNLLHNLWRYFRIEIKIAHKNTGNNKY
jgi:hypothetical protein